MRRNEDNDMLDKIQSSGDNSRFNTQGWGQWQIETVQ